MRNVSGDGIVNIGMQEKVDNIEQFDLVLRSDIDPSINSQVWYNIKMRKRVDSSKLDQSVIDNDASI